VSESQVPRNTAVFSLREIADATGGERLRPGMSTHVRGVSTDTRALSGGELFIALRGERFDGHSMLNKAAEAGAIAALVEEESDAPDSLGLIRVVDTKKALGDLARANRLKFDIPVVGVTGSYGKTTTRALIAAALGAKFRVLASEGNFNNEIGVPMTLFGVDESHGAAVVEMGMRGLGQIAYLAQVAAPTIGVITNIGPQHIELLGSLENIARAKAELIQALPSDGIAILPVEGDALPHEYSCTVREGAPHRIVTFGRSEDAGFRVSEIQTARGGNISFSLRDMKGVLHRVSLSMPGAHNALNAACAIAVASVLGVEIEAAIGALGRAQVPGARMRIVPCDGVTVIDDCYNAGPDSMRAALETLRAFPDASRRVAVLGAMKELGQWSEDEHRKVGKLAVSCAEVLMGVGEETRAMLESAGGIQNIWCEDAAAAASRIGEIAREGDVILVKGSRSVGLEIVVQAVMNAHGVIK
jgi:UDP-N-acetylmuramoyl-tripeptide--D-alanyl-D-alanine ligase